MAERLRARAAAERARGVQVAGPAPAYVARRADRWRFNVVLRGADPVALLDPPPGAPWSVDVDPGDRCCRATGCEARRGTDRRTEPRATGTCANPREADNGPQRDRADALPEETR